MWAPGSVFFLAGISHVSDVMRFSVVAVASVSPCYATSYSGLSISDEICRALSLSCG